MAFAFDGTDTVVAGRVIDYGSSTDIDNLTDSKDFSLSIWIKLNSGTVDGGIDGYFVCKIGAALRGWIIFFDAIVGGTPHINRIKIFVRESVGPANTSDVYTDDAITEGEEGTWIHLGYTQTEGALPRLYKNGVEQTKSKNSALTGYPEPGASLEVGQSSDNNRLGFKGSVSHLAIWSDQILTGSEFTSIANGTDPRNVQASSIGFYAPMELASDMAEDIVGDQLPTIHTATIDTSNPTSAYSAIPGDDVVFVFLPDTQSYTTSDAEATVYFNTMTQWIVNNRTRESIAFVAHGGDLINNWNNNTQWARVLVAMDILHDATPIVPYSVLPGNHDFDAIGGTRIKTRYNNNFGSARYDDFSWYLGREDSTNDNNYCTFTASELDFIILNLEFGADNDMLAWGDTILRANPQKYFIVITHAYTYQDNSRQHDNGGQNFVPTVDYGFNATNANNGDDFWDKLIKKYHNIIMVLSGHNLGDGTGRQTATSIKNTLVYEILANYQDGVNPPVGGSESGGGFFRIIKFIPSENKIKVRSFSAVNAFNHSHYLLGDANNFDLSFDYTKLKPLISLSLPTGSRGTVLTLNYPTITAVKTQWQFKLGGNTFTITTTDDGANSANVLHARRDFIDIWFPPMHSFSVRTRQSDSNGIYDDWSLRSSFTSRGYMTSYDNFFVLNANTQTIS